MNKIEGKITLVTGGNRGIGLPRAKAFVNEGAILHRPRCTPTPLADIPVPHATGQTYGAVLACDGDAERRTKKEARS